MGHRAPKPMPTAIERVKQAYVDGSIELSEFEERVCWLIGSGNEGNRSPVPYEALRSRVETNPVRVHRVDVSSYLSQKLSDMVRGESQFPRPEMEEIGRSANSR